MLLRQKAVEPGILRPARSASMWRNAWRHLLRNRSGQVGLLIIGILLFVAIFAPIIATHDPITFTDPNNRVRVTPCIHLFGCPSSEPQHIFGLDGNGRDLFSRVVHATRVSLFIGIATVTFAIIVGTLIGALSGYVGGWLDNVLMRLMDVLLAFPSLLLAIALVAVLRPLIVQGLNPLLPALFAIGFVGIPIYARIVRASVLSIKELDYVTADKALGVPASRTLFRTILPNALTPLIVQGTLGIASGILDAAALGFLGLGQQPPHPEWGTMLGVERNSVFNGPHLLIFPGLAIMLTVLAFNLLGDGLRDALDPRLNR
ncbi:MAG: ABC transporter permease [Chloroflexota bacterium]|nr:ABC transporter permease [Chloroflexota bacterium]MDQ5867587.1 ABC transporter permease [Chloroflexota bacterium]